jgi:cysteinyl-tRNA synthetase
MAGQRVDIEPGKRNPADFALWRASDPGRLMNWDSPWGLGFPGWHIECSAMAAELLAEQIDIHTGGVDNLFPHHEDERAQSEAANGKSFVKYWVHTAHLLFGAEKMSKSLGNIATVTELIERSINPLAFRYFLLQGHYRKQISLTDDSMEGAQIGLERLYDQVAELSQATPGQIDGTEEFRPRFHEAINDDLGTPRALAILQEALESSLSPASKLHLLGDMDRIFGLDILTVAKQRSTLTEPEAALVAERKEAREAKDWDRSDALRLRLAESGIEIRDTPDGQRWLRRR